MGDYQEELARLQLEDRKKADEFHDWENGCFGKPIIVIFILFVLFVVLGSLYNSMFGK